MVNAITTRRLRILGIMGHSNAHSFAGSDQMLLDYPGLIHRKVSFLSPEESYWENIYVFTNAHGWPGPSGTPPTYTVSDGAWLEMTTNYPESPNVAHPHPSPYTYPNTTGGPYPNHLLNAVTRNGDTGHGTGALAGVELPLMNRLSHYWSDQVGLIKIAIPSSLFLRYDFGFTATDAFGFTGSTPDSYVDPTEGYFNWFTPSDRFDWQPSTGRLYKSWIDKSVAAMAALPTGTTGSMDHVVCWFGDNDCRFDSPRVAYWEDDVRKFVKQLRADMVANNLTTLPPEQIRIIWMGVHQNYELVIDGQAAEMNAAVQRVVANDLYMRFVPVSDFPVFSGVDEFHYKHTAYYIAHERIFEAIKEMDVDPEAALDTDELLTVDQMRDRIRLHYSRGNVRTDLKDDVLLLHLNGALHHVTHQCGDWAYWASARAPLDLSGEGFGRPVTLPRYVKRLLEVEDPQDATYFLHFDFIGHADGGRVQVILREAVSGTYTCRFIKTPRDLTTDEQLVPLPANLTEWLVCEVCLRLARASSDPIQIAEWKAETMRLQADVLRNMSQTQRARRDRLHTVRRLPDVLGRRRGR